MPQSRNMADKMKDKAKVNSSQAESVRSEDPATTGLAGDREMSHLQPSDGVQEQEALQPPCKKANSSTELLSSESITTIAQSILDEMEDKRKNDQTLLADFRKDFDLHVETSSNMLAQALDKIYAKNNNSCQEKLQELNTILEQISQLEHEMSSFKQSLNMLFTEVNPGQ